MPRRDSHQDLRQKLEAVETRISHHLFQLPGIAESLRIVAQSTGKDADAVDAVLASRGLPGLEELGRKQLRHMFSWWKLHRDRRVLQKRMAKARRD